VSSESAPERGLGRLLFSGEGWPYLLVPIIPLAIALDLGNAGAGVVFFASAAGVIPTAASAFRATST
jgi:Ca2+:H+ antiporter